MNQWKQVDPLMQRQGEAVLQKLLNNGHQAYFVGGCVRDELMGRPVHDMDIATSAKPEEVMILFSRTVPTGLQHGTVTVLMDEYSFEVTTFRKESQYEDHRRPTRVEFVNGIVQDLQRRDFTMNAIACDVHGELTDPYGGQQDIKRRTIRCVGKAEERFDEDALRMMRAVRFTSVFAFRPVKSLWIALLRDRDKLSFIAIERIRAELERMMEGPHPLRGLEMLRRSRLIEYAKAPIPAIDQPKMEYMQALHNITSEPLVLRWSLLLQGLGVHSEEGASMMRKWTFSGDVVQGTTHIIQFDEHWQAARKQAMDRELLRKEWITLELKYGQETAVNWLIRQETISSEWEIAQMHEEEWSWHKGMVVHHISELDVNGGEVISFLERKGGPWLGELMKELLFHVACGELSNVKEDILEHAKVVVNI